MTQTAIIIVHRRQSRVGRLGSKLRARGWELDIRCPMEGDGLPESLGEYDAVAVLGGPMSANDDHLPGVRAELDWISKAVNSGTPYFGICLGAQLLARALGGTVAPHPHGHAEMGYYPVFADAAGEALIDPGLCVYHWHRDGFTVPPDAVRLARGETFPNQAFRYRNAFGIQFHPEVTREIMESWIAGSSHRLALPGAQCPESQRIGYQRHHAPLGDWLDRFLDHWLGEGQVIPD